MQRLRETGPRLATRAKAGLRALVGRRAEFRFAVRVTAAGFLSFLLAGSLGLPQSYWVMLTAVIVMQANIGSSLKAATDRLVGTLAGAFMGFLATLVAANGFVAEGAVFAFALGPLAFLSACHPSFKVAPVTAIIVMMSRTGHEPAFWLAIERVFEILLGGVIGVAVSLLMLPARAHSDLAERVSGLLILLAEIWKLEVANLTGAADAASARARLQAVNDRVRLKLAATEASGEDAKRERSARLTESGDPDALLRTLRRLRHDFILVGRASTTPWPRPVLAKLKAPLAHVAEALDAGLYGLAAAAKRRAVPPSTDEVTAAIDAFGDALEELRGERFFAALASEIVASLFTIGFAFEELRREVPELGNRLAEFAAETESGA